MNTRISDFMLAAELPESSHFVWSFGLGEKEMRLKSALWNMNIIEHNFNGLAGFGDYFLEHVDNWSMAVGHVHTTR